MTTPIRDSIKLYAVGEFHFLLFEKLAKLALPLLFPSRLSTACFSRFVLVAKIFKLDSSVCVVQNPLSFPH